MAGMVNMPNMGVYNVTQACGGVAQRDAVPGSVPGHRPDRRLRAVPVFRAHRHPASQRNRPADMQRGGKPTRSQLIAQAMTDKAVGSGRSRPRRWRNS